MLIARRKENQVALTKLDRISIEQPRVARAFRHQMVRNHVIRGRHQYIGDLAGRCGEVGPLGAQFHLEKYGAREPYGTQHLGQCIHGAYRSAKRGENLRTQIAGGPVN